MEKKFCDEMLEKVRASKTLGLNNKRELEQFLLYEQPGNCLYTKWTEPPVIERGQGCKVYDVDGREFYDCTLGMSSMNIGHGDPRVAEVCKEQYLKLSHWFDFPSPERNKLAKRLCEITPGNFPKKVWFGLSGSDAVDAAIRAVRYFTKKPQIITFFGGYHGQNIGTMALSGKGGQQRWYRPVPPEGSSISHFPYAYCYRCPYGREYPTCDMQCIKTMDYFLSSSETALGNPMGNINNVAAVIVEPMQCSAGYILPPKEFLQGVRKLADKYGFLMIVDEIQTGLGRTGRLWACEHSGIIPDVILVGKALGGGIPMSAAVLRADIVNDFTPGATSNTYAGYAVGCAVANKVLDIYEEDKLVENCAEIGRYISPKLAELKGKHPCIGHYDQVGVFMCIEIIKNGKEPASREAQYIVDAMYAGGLLAYRNGYYGNRITFIPPLTWTKDDVDNVFIIIEKSIEEGEKSFD